MTRMSHQPYCVVALNANAWALTAPDDAVLETTQGNIYTRFELEKWAHRLNDIYEDVITLVSPADAMHIRYVLNGASKHSIRKRED